MRLQRAFLSYSSSDSEFVSAVAHELGRQLVMFDQFAFENGVDFRKSIQEGFSESSVFVLFASSASLSSDWVKFEQEEAWYKKLRGKLSHSLVFLIDSGVTHRDIPEWLSRGRVSPSNSVKGVARDIRFHLSASSMEIDAPIFVGQAKEIESLQRAIIGLDNSEYPNAPIVSGLSGIGRRSVIRRAVPSVLNLNKFVEIRISGGASIQEVSGGIATEVEPYSGLDGFNQIMEEILQLTSDEAIYRSHQNIQKMNQMGEYPIFLDDGGLVDSSGYLTRMAVDLREMSKLEPTVYFAIVSRRSPRGPRTVKDPVIRVGGLENGDTRHLLAMLARRHSVSLTEKQIEDMAGLVAGYPPAAHFAILEAKSYGPHLVAGSRSPISSFLADAFIRRLGEENLAESQILILRLLYGYSPLPLSVIGKVVKISPEKLQEKLMRMIEAHLISPTPDGLYKIADPISVAVRRAFGAPDKRRARQLARLVDSYLEENQDDRPSFALVTSFFRMAVNSGSQDLVSKVVKLSGSYYDVAQSQYENREYDECIDNAMLALQADANNARIIGLLVRAYIQAEKYDQARPRIRDVERLGYHADAAFLSGFLERKRGNYERAIEFFERSGRTDQSTSRELASCYLYTNENEKAKVHIDRAMKLAPDNSWLIDLAIQIEANLGNEDRVRELMLKYEDVGDLPFVSHRRARIALSKDDWVTAARYAAEAVNASEGKAPSQFYSAWITALLAGGKIVEARSALEEMNLRLGEKSRDIRMACECNCLNAEGRYSQALNLAATISNQDTRYVKKILLDAYQGEIRSSVLDDNKRAEYRGKERYLRSELMGWNRADLIPDERHLD